MNKAAHVFLEHILESIGWVEKDVEGLSKEAFLPMCRCRMQLSDG